MLESKFLKDNIENIQKLMSLPPLRNFETKSLRQLLKMSKIREYAHGELIIREGDIDPWLYFLLSGKVRVRKQGVDLFILDNIGDIFGEMRLLDGLDRSASVYAEGKTVCLAVQTSATDRLEVEEEKANFLVTLYRMFSEFVTMRLRLTNEELVRVKKELDHLS
ncbi:MAG: cyclic nucleotide-binding domain-containing protein [Desulfobacterales bacterium]|nr:cyclic nucleotide-binding domain-containing protein [Desulfobacterales bacterium]MDJ0912805.1 cyclic nucleotide-binding domain-containing protein [Desulfobacterales bacterium]